MNTKESHLLKQNIVDTKGNIFSCELLTARNLIRTFQEEISRILLKEENLLKREILLDLKITEMIKENRKKIKKRLNEQNIKKVHINLYPSSIINIFNKENTEVEKISNNILFNLMDFIEELTDFVFYIELIENSIISEYLFKKHITLTLKYFINYLRLINNNVFYLIDDVCDDVNCNNVTKYTFDNLNNFLHLENLAGIKIDLSFIRNFDIQKENFIRMYKSNIINLDNKIIVFEGVENERQFKQLLGLIQSLDSSYFNIQFLFQGFYFHKPEKIF